MLNRTCLNGRLTKDIELQYTNSNIAFTKFTLAVPRNYKDSKSNEYESDFIRCVAWRGQAEYLANNTKKGMLVGIDGHIQTGSYENESGGTIYTTDIVCDSVSKLSFEPKQQALNSEPYVKPVAPRDKIDVSSEDLPF